MTEGILAFLKKAIKEGVVIKQTAPNVIWPIIEEVVRAQHNSKPVHSADEMQKLQDKFPNNIVCWSADLDGEALACVVTFITRNVVHAQYIANSETGRKIGALDLLFTELITKFYKDWDYFDFGISTENEGKHLNGGLINQKQGFGGRGIAHEFFRLDK